ncbi:MAG TPA: SEC-C metal-binding domain-containing protein [Bryobacteraceae bacterium]|nr:SEC-C metal-binding domain-containing protein [Bryobacteraceae bacterium]
MATDAQIAANRANAQASTGPATAAGKANSSRNALSSGLFSQGDFVRPDEHEQYAEFCGAFTKDLAPLGAIELTLSAEIIHAAWRLRRCSAIEATLTPANGLDPIADEASEGRAWRAVDRARAQATRTLHRTIAELRRIQTERQHRAEFLQGFDRSVGLASLRDLLPPPPMDVRRRLFQRKETEFTKQSQSAAPITGRNSPCACGSGIKFKRCCGKGAPPLLRNSPLQGVGIQAGFLTLGGAGLRP